MKKMKRKVLKVKRVPKEVKQFVELHPAPEPVAELAKLVAEEQIEEIVLKPDAPVPSWWERWFG
jgi:hypothetical protein